MIFEKNFLKFLEKTAWGTKKFLFSFEGGPDPLLRTPLSKGVARMSHFSKN